jgi:ribosomal protein S27E
LEAYNQKDNIAMSSTKIIERCAHCHHDNNWLSNKLKPTKCCVCGATLINDGKNVIES